jgi:hypothetical protein
MKKILAIVVLAAAWPALAQTSASYKLEEHTFNAGGHPADGTIMTSASFRMTFDAIGEGIAGGGMSSASFSMDGGFVSAFPPPGEVTNLLFTDDVTLVWDPEKSVGVYNLYRDTLGTLSGMGYGNCEQYDIGDETATDPDTPPTSDGYFYLVTAENRIAEEGTKGYDSDHSERPNPAACP